MHLYTALISLTLLILSAKLLHRDRVKTRRINHLEKTVKDLNLKFDKYVARNNGISRSNS
jgi:hypothetical protein